MKKTFTGVLVAVLLGSALTSCGDNTIALDPTNPFSKEWTAQNGMPPFDLVKEVHIIPALKAGISQASVEIDKITSSTHKPTFENTILAYQKVGELLKKVGLVYGPLTATELNNELKAIQPEYISLSSEHRSNVSLNGKLFERIKMVFDDKDNQKYTPEQYRLIEKTYDSFARAGANLSAADKERMRAIDAQLGKLHMEFGNATNGDVEEFKMIVKNKADLAGLSEGSIGAAAQKAKELNLDGQWVFTLKKPSYIPFMQNSTNRDLRKVMFEGYSNVGNNNNANDTKVLIKQLVKLRLEKAQLLGYKTFAEYNLKNSMAKTPEAVFSFIETMWVPVIERAKEEVKDMGKLMAKDGIKDKVQPWDWFYYAEKVRADKYDLDENELKPYFAVNNVRDGAQYVANQLFGLTFEEVKDAVRINPETQVFNVYDKDGSFLSVLTWDFFPRSSKRGGAWCSRVKPQEYINGKRVAPIVTITCNFTPPVGDDPALITTDEVVTLFHEFGHAVQGMLSDVEYPGMSTNPRDFVEFPSQVMERWAYEPQMLKQYAKHYKTGKVIPNSLIKKIQKSATFNQGFVNGENLASSYLDMVFHSIDNAEVAENIDILEFEKATLAKLGVIEEFIPRYRTTYFGHTWTGGYAAGYYSYKWSEVLSADGFAAFKDSGDIFNPEIAIDLREKVLSKGSSVDEKTMYEDWRGAEADGKHLLKSLGFDK